MTGKMQQMRTSGTKLEPGVATSCALLQLRAAQKLLRVALLLQPGAAAPGAASTLTKSAGRGCKGSWLLLEGQREAVQFSRTPGIGLTLLPFCTGSLLQTPLPAL